MTGVEKSPGNYFMRTKKKRIGTGDVAQGIEGESDILKMRRSKRRRITETTSSQAQSPTPRAQENSLLSVSCGNKEGILYVDKFASGEPCIESEQCWFTPSAFENFGGKASSKKWKQSICHKNEPLQFWIEQCVLPTMSIYSRGSETKKKIQSRNRITDSSSEESEIQSINTTEEDDDKDSDWTSGSEKLAAETEDESVAAENGGEVVDSGDDKSQDDVMEDEDKPAVTESDEDNGVLEERETKLIPSSLKKNASLQKEAKVVIKRLPEAVRYSTSSGMELPLTGNEEDEDAQKEESEPGGVAVDNPVDPSQTSDPPTIGDVEEEAGEEFTQSDERKEDGQREIETSSVLTVAQRAGDTRDDDSNAAATEGPVSTGADLDTMDLDQLKREKIKMQLKVLKLQDEYYTLKIKELKK